MCTASGIAVNGATGQPVPHAQVATSSKGAATDASGVWSIAGLTCGPLRFTAERAGYLPGSASAAGSSKDIRLTLMPESSIGGSVLDEAGDPVAGAEIQVYDSSVRQGRRVMREAGTVNTNGAGEYRAGFLKGGVYRFCAHSSKTTWPVGGGDALLYMESCYPAEPLRIAGGQELRQNFTLRAVRGVHVRGTVSGLPEDARAVIQIGRATARIAVDGRFDVAGIVPGAYTIEGIAEVDGRSVLASAQIQVGDAGLDRVVLAFVPSVVVTGTVRFESGEPIAVTVNLVPSDPAWDSGKAEVDESGRLFTFPSVAPGKYRVVVPAMRKPWYVKSIELQGQDISERELTIASATGPIEIVASDAQGSVSGTVVDSGGKPAAGDILLLRGDHAPEIGHSESDGSFTMGGVPPGEYSAYAFPDSREAEYADALWMRQNAGVAVPVSVSAGGAARCALILARPVL